MLCGEDSEDEYFQNKANDSFHDTRLFDSDLPPQVTPNLDGNGLTVPEYIDPGLLSSSVPTPYHIDSFSQLLQSSPPSSQGGKRERHDLTSDATTAVSADDSKLMAMPQGKNKRRKISPVS